MAFKTVAMPFVGAPQTGDRFWDEGFLFLVPTLPAIAWAYPIRVDMYLQQTDGLDRVSCSPWLMNSPSEIRGTPSVLNAEFNFPDTAAWSQFSVGNFGPIPPEPRYLGLLSERSTWSRNRVQISSVTLTYTAEEDPGDAGTIELTKNVEGADLRDLTGVGFPVFARNDREEVIGFPEVTWRGELEPVQIVISRGLVTFEEQLDGLPTTIGNRRARWREPIFDPPFVEVNPGGIYPVTVTNRVTYPGGMWNTRQRQGATGVTGGWPLRQRQNGGATGSWPLRQRQTGM
ncbi:hypothetical protein [Sanguibacter inulinus]|uniref:Uncharacterized protein n=1 Tax=Sanguibacter inulinus TaxID=60922 RepID=A0A853EPI9_9MICO|nr:hypothetical protein [Sanguibacter inulinus]MBF0721390.1 hypothetical protein [Sanguibacter inulinus]NYS92535.1 hypothetical protein [Sanguibacter inulinus]